MATTAAIAQLEAVGSERDQARGRTAGSIEGSIVAYEMLNEVLLPSNWTCKNMQAPKVLAANDSIPVQSI